jgi:short chain dehydrogenase
MAGPFGAMSTTDDVLSGKDLSGKRVLVTGVSAGLGVETARALVAHGAQVVGAARDLAKAERATVEVRTQAANGGGFELVELDLASLESVRACADALVALGAALRRSDRQCRRDADALRPHRRRFRNAGRDQPSRPFRAGEPNSRAAGSSMSPPPAIAIRTLTSMIRTSNAHPTIRPSPMAGPRRPTFCLQWNSTGATRRAA